MLLTFTSTFFGYLILKVCGEDFRIFYKNMVKDFDNDLSHADKVFPKYKANHSSKTLFDILDNFKNEKETI